ncbi:MAG: hypothetical protein K2O32_12250 [Acetatifactor sp.]|nr:hypothetical protein [Acetatifactor sp.]
MWKKIRRIIIRTVLWLFCLWLAWVFLGAVWSVLGEYMPLEKTRFKSYQAYHDYPKRCFGSGDFVDKIPTSAEDLKYYWHSAMRVVVTAYSMTLDTDTYEEVKNDRINFYVEEAAEEYSSHSLLYEARGDERQYLDGSEWYRKKLGYVDMVLHHPEVQQQYYFGAAMRVNIYEGVSYNGVIVNDTTHEIIEFSAAMPDREDFEESSVRGGEVGTWIIVIALVSIPFWIVGAMILLDKWIDKRNEKNEDKRCENES